MGMCMSTFAVSDPICILVWATTVVGGSDVLAIVVIVVVVVVAVAGVGPGLTSGRLTLAAVSWMVGTG